MAPGPAQRSLWDATATPALALRPLQGAAEAQVVVVGAGYAGLSCALHLAERGVSVTVLEAATVGAGASGRNGGHVLHGGQHALADLVARLGPAAGERLHAFGIGATDAAFALIERLGLQCHALRAGSIFAADSPAGQQVARIKLRALQAAGIDGVELSRDQIIAATGSQAYIGGYLNPKGGGVQPLSLARELARATQRAGADVYEQSAVLAIERSGHDWVLRTTQGRIKARRVLLATNGSSGGAWPGLERSALPVWSFQVATDPLPSSSGVLPAGQVVSDTRRLLTYFRRDHAGRLIIGGKGTAGAPRGLASFNLQRRTMERLYPQLKGQRLQWWWGGQVSITLDRLPRLFVLGEGLLASMACNGKGVAWNLALGPVLADALCGVPLHSLPLPPARSLQTIPLHGLKRLYAAAGSGWLRLLDGLDSRSLPSFTRP
jgi:glycine/D-amino acid oxidase-like deaminating enzyme